MLSADISVNSGFVRGRKKRCVPRKKTIARNSKTDKHYVMKLCRVTLGMKRRMMRPALSALWALKGGFKKDGTTQDGTTPEDGTTQKRWHNTTFRRWNNTSKCFSKKTSWRYKVWMRMARHWHLEKKRKKRNGLVSEETNLLNRRLNLRRS